MTKLEPLADPRAADLDPGEAVGVKAEDVYADYPHHPTHAGLKRAAVASSVGSALEYYDFAIYGAASALVLGQLFFPGQAPGVALVASFGIYAVGFLARPVGGFFFGSLGDRIGRKAVLMATIALMGAATTLIGLLPTHAAVGVWAPVLLILCRMLQGFGAGAEQAGASLLMAEFAPPRRRGVWAVVPFMGISIGTTLAAGVFALVARLPDDDLLSWGWRLPFLASVILVGVSVWIRLTMKESPAFEELREQEKTAASPLSELVARGRGTVLRGIGLRMGENGTSYLYSTFSFSYLVGVVGTSKSIGPLALAVASVCAVATLPLFGWLSDRYGRRKVYRWGALFQALFAFPAFALLNTGNTLVIVLTVTVAIAVGVDSMLGAQCAYLPELFGSRYRYLGVAASRELSAVIAGGIAPLVGAALLVAFTNAWWPVALYAAVLAVISYATTFFVPETAGRSLLDERNAA